MITAQSAIGIFSNSQDIGRPKNPGSSSYNTENQIYTIKGSGYNIWFERDEFHYLYKKIKGNFILTANVDFLSEGGDPHRKLGWMARASEEDNASHISATVHGDGLTVLQWRELKGAFMRDPQDQIFSPKHHYNIIQLERTGNNFIMRAAHYSEPLQLIGSHFMNDMPEEILAGLFVCAHDPDQIEEARFWNVRVDHPVAENYNPGREGYLGCRMETMNVFTGMRKIIFEKPDRFEAPNWMPDGEHLLFNMDGSLYTIPANGGNPIQLNTGFANRNNNDHGISFDGKMIALSHHREGMREGGSTIYVVPIKGGTPKIVTQETPSYWHGWAPNNKEVVYVAKRGTSTSYNIFKSSIENGIETQLTFHEGTHVDGPEYSPDGKYIYYNGSQSGTMQIWRMKPDGTAKEQLTFDQYNDWFPHISPDGQWMVFLSFPDTVDVDSHPSYKRAMLRLMPASGGAPKAIAYLYGGQGTINVPSWAPDNKHIAFVSNSGN